MELVGPIIVALILVVVAWKLLKGVARTLALLAIAAFAGLYVFGGGLA